MRHPVEFKQFLHHVKLLRGATDMCQDNLFGFDGLSKRIIRGRGGNRGDRCGRGGSGSRKHKTYQMRHMSHGGNVPFFRLVRKHKLANATLLEPLPTEVTLDHIQLWIEKGSLDPNKPIDMSLLVRAKLLQSCEDGVKLTAPNNPSFYSKINIVVTEADLEAIKLVEQHGGTIQCRYYTPAELKFFSKPADYIHKQSPEHALPKNRDQIEYYCDPVNRGYLADGGGYAQGALLKVFKDSYLLNKKKRPLPENLSQHKIREPDEVSFANDPRVYTRDYVSTWARKKRQAHLDHRGTDQFARRLLRADANTETAV